MYRISAQKLVFPHSRLVGPWQENSSKRHFDLKTACANASFSTCYSWGLGKMRPKWQIFQWTEICQGRSMEQTKRRSRKQFRTECFPINRAQPGSWKPIKNILQRICFCMELQIIMKQSQIALLNEHEENNRNHSKQSVCCETEIDRQDLWRSMNAGCAPDATVVVRLRLF